jgi:two-component system LytT family sensor kinase
MNDTGSTSVRAVDDSTSETEIFPFNLTGVRRLLFWWGIWTFLGLLQAARLYVAYNSGDEIYISWAQACTWALADLYIWGLLSLVIFRITRFTSFTSKTWPRDLLIHLGSAFILGAVQLFLYSIAYRPLGELFWHKVGQSVEWTLLTLWQDLMFGKMHAAVLTYFLIAFIYFTLQYHARYRDAEQRRALLQSQLVTAQLDALKMQLHPHFLFNTLNAITALIHSDPEAADRMTARLSDLLRVTLDSEAVQEVPLRKELEFLESYLDIQRMRFGDRLRVKLEAAPECLDAYVPNMILQPLVENAVQHGIAPRTEPGVIGVSVQRTGDVLQLQVYDDGPGLHSTEADSQESGRGISNTRRRLQQLYDNRQTFALRNGSAAGLQVIMTIPFHTQPVSAEAK